MSGKTFEIDFNDLKITSSQIEAVLGYKEEEDRELVRGLIEEILIECRTITSIKAQYEIFKEVKFNPELKSVIIDSKNFQVKKIVYAQLKKSDTVALFICTAGAEIGIRSQIAMKERDFLRGYLYDVAGSEIVEVAADILQDELKHTLLESGRKITNRYSPGYCGWDVAEQHKLFGFFPDNFCGISLTPSALMYPVKSVSGIIGAGKDVKLNPYTCKMCDMKDCVFSRGRVSRSFANHPS